MRTSSLGRTLAYDDPQVGPGPNAGENSGEPGGQGDPTQVGPNGRRADRNVELVLGDPRARPAAADDGSGAGRPRSTPPRKSAPSQATQGASAPDRADDDSEAVPAGDGGPLPFTGRDLLWMAAVGCGAGGGRRRAAPAARLT